MQHYRLRQASVKPGLRQHPRTGDGQRSWQIATSHLPVGCVQAGQQRESNPIETLLFHSTEYNTHTTMFARRAIQQVRAPVLRRNLSGAADNAFNRERAAVKDHAAASSGMSTSLYHHQHKRTEAGRVIVGSL